jgi:hypothetical protein
VEQQSEYCFLMIQHWSTCMTKGEWSGWMQAAGAIFALALAILLPVVQSWRRDRLVRKAHLQTIAMDVRINDRQASVYLTHKVGVPAYRLPLYGTLQALPALLAEGKLSTAQATAMVQYYVDAHSFNRSLDLAQALMHDGSNGLMLLELQRTRMKAEHLVPSTKLSRYDEIIKALRRAGLKDKELERIPADISVDDEPV